MTEKEKSNDLQSDVCADLNDTFHTTIFGIGTVKISDMAKQTMKHSDN